MSTDELTCPFCNTSFMSAGIVAAHKERCDRNPANNSNPSSPDPNLFASPLMTPVDDGLRMNVDALHAENGTIDTARHSEFLYPSPVSGIRIEESIMRKILRVMEMSERTGAPQNMLFLGESGTGKTTLAYHIAGLFKRPLAKINMQTKTQAAELYGFREANPAEGTRYVLGQFAVACMKPQCICLLDDVAHSHDRTINNGLLPALDDTRVVWLDYLGQYVPVAEGVVFIGTGNQGRQYGGAMKLDHAIVSRFDNRIKFQAPDIDTTAQILAQRTGVGYDDAQRLARFASQVKEKGLDIVIDMRGLLAASRDIVFGATFFESVVYTLLGDLDDAQRDAVRFELHDNMSEQENEEAARAKHWIEWRA